METETDVLDEYNDSDEYQELVNDLIYPLDVFDVDATLFPHQRRCFKSALRKVLDSDSEDRGYAVIPTGGGKTLIEFELIRRQCENQKGKVILLLVPRIALNRQHFNNFQKYAEKHNMNALPILFCSDSGKTENAKIRGIEYFTEITTSGQTLCDNYDRATRQDANLVVLSTYHSGKRAVDSLSAHGVEIDLVIADECHNIVRDDFRYVPDIAAKKLLFFTATPIWSDSSNGVGMNNAAAFGNKFYEITPRTLIEKGFIVPPLIRHEILEIVDDVDFTKEVRYKAECKGVVDILKSANPNKRNKILMAAPGTEAIHHYIHDAELLDTAAHCGYDVMAICSREGKPTLIWFNGIRLSNRNQLFKKIKDANKCIIFHYDMLSEGIDIPDFTHLILARKLNTNKLIQTIGRVLRLLPSDRALGYEVLADKQQRLAKAEKPYAWVIVFNCTSDRIGQDNYLSTRDIVTALRKGGLEYEVYREHDPRGIPEEEELDRVENSTEDFELDEVDVDCYAVIEPRENLF